MDYERFVAETLEQLGWATALTGRSGDQGIDVIATRDGRRIVVQCKLYTRPVGNAAVQEVIAGREFERADGAVVVSNTRFTPAARRLAAAAGVQLLHHDELAQLAARDQ